MSEHLPRTATGTEDEAEASSCGCREGAFAAVTAVIGCLLYFTFVGGGIGPWSAGRSWLLIAAFFGGGVAGKIIGISVAGASGRKRRAIRSTAYAGPTSRGDGDGDGTRSPRG